MMPQTVPCTIMRGGTSKGIFFMEKNIPPPGSERDALLLKVMGSPDRRQIDGLGGADPLTSKVAIISPSERPDADINYTFAQVDLQQPLVGYAGNCGNITAATGLFAIQEGLVGITEPFTVVKVFNTNTKKMLLLYVPCSDGAPEEEGTYVIDGVPGSSPRIDIDFSLTAGAVTGKLLPTGNTADLLEVPGLGEIKCSIVDIANPCAFVHAGDLGLNGRETPEQLEKMPEIKKNLELIRTMAGKLAGIPENPGLPMLAFVSAPDKDEREYNIISRLMFMQAMHKAYSGTAAICTAVAAGIKGTIANAYARYEEGEINIGHPLGGIAVEVRVNKNGNVVMVEKAAIGRTARRILDGNVFINMTGKEA